MREWNQPIQPPDCLLAECDDEQFVELLQEEAREGKDEEEAEEEKKERKMNNHTTFCSFPHCSLSLSRALICACASKRVGGSTENSHCRIVGSWMGKK